LVKTYAELYLQARRALLAQEDGDSASFMARELLSHVSGLSREQVIANREHYASEQACEEMPKLVERLLQGEPLAYVLGYTEFMGLRFHVEPGVLVPRQDTETLVEWVLKAEKAPKTLLDMCTGSGCIGLSLAKLGDFQVTLSDLSPRAIHVSRINRGGLDLEEQVEICHGDLFEALPEGKRFDIIVSNPPYIETAVIEELQEEVRDHEPRMALDGMEDGLFFYRKLAKEAPQWLTPGGRIYLEIGYDQGESVPALLQEAGFVDVTVKKDLAGNDRVVRGVYPHV